MEKYLIQLMNIFSKYTILFLLLISKLTYSNIARPPEPISGHIVGQGKMEDIYVLGENLHINLKDITENGNAKIIATYDIYASQLIKNLELIFVANSLYKTNFDLEVDDKPTNGYIKYFDTIPESWNPPDTLTFNKEKIPFIYTHKGLISFTIDSITKGRHIIRVSYDAMVAEWYDKNDLSITRSFVYILKPDNGWKDFENLNINLFIPDGWEYSSNLDFKSAYSSLRGSWEKLPAHSFTIVLRPKETWAKVLTILFIIITPIISIVILLFWMYVVAKFQIKKGKSFSIRIINNIIVGLIVSVLFFIIYLNAPDIKNSLLDNHLNPLINYGRVYIVFAFPIVLIIALVLTFITEFFISKKIKRKLDCRNVKK